MRLTVGGVLVYAGIVVLLVVQTVRLIQMDQLWADGIAFTPVCLVAVVAATALMFLVGAVARQPLIDGDGPWFSTLGWAVVIGLTGVGMAITALASYGNEAGVWVTGPAVFVPFWVRKLEESYREGVEEGLRERS
ncbi:hypothetical protein F1D05_26630 [Kribbella qitaiheensis]|uniref:Integral membrane protein n=1 Tax=Kribbella qitaiheensis TaxID=1544730 RepID=A0A7G6X3M1_9ACTN|nr:hypothetical protein [Kribbella qitaiheensis]QNE20836.1 hypothetical protein F1D05_26630 [Kribbella qitaiheensis]